ncbi:MAG: tRNA preQ1(34) S-adenosylmethionine ribosyltransferase-isomerase QueA [Kiritimatiellia bacterium]
MKTRQFWYPLPERLIAQHPAERRGTEKMLVLHRDTGVVEHRHIADIADYITADDLLVVNDTKVFPARLVGEWTDTHGSVEVLMVNAAPTDADDGRPSMTAAKDALRWNAIIGSGRRCREGQVAAFGPNRELQARLLKPLPGIGMWQVEFVSDRPLMELLDEFGRTPVPPYVKREGTAEEEREDRERYQTIYAREVGSVAAPTAGLHFTPEIFAALAAKGVRRVAVTLHVGPGTFRPVKADNVEEHRMDFEAFSVPPGTADAINACKARGGRVFCVGSTTVRALESVAAASADGRVAAGTGASDIFIYPPYRFRVCDCMLTNFHLPQSTLLMMVSALAGRERVLCAYAMAVRKNYMFFSYGDCMLIV